MSELERVADGVWSATGPVSIVGMALTTTMVVIQLEDGSVLLHSPLPMTPERRAEVEVVGRVAHLYAPNTFHHLWLGEWAAAFPEARVHAPAGLRAKRAELRIDRTHGDGAPPPGLDEIRIDGFRLEESVLVHRASRTLVVADLVHHVGTPPGVWTKTYATLMGFYGKVAQSSMLRWVGYTDRRAARRSVDAVLAHDFDRIVVGHGAPVVVSAREQLRAACAWMPA